MKTKTESSAKAKKTKKSDEAPKQLAGHNWYIDTIFEISTTTDEWGTLGDPVGFARTEYSASSMARGQGWYGTSGKIRKVKAIFVDDLVFPLSIEGPVVLHESHTKTEQELLIESAMSKLTPAEAHALGVSR